MQKVIIDTNVLVSALIQKSYPNLIMNNLFIENKFNLCVSDELVEEYYEVLARPKFSKFIEFYNRADIILTEILSQAKFYTPNIKLNLIKDEKDNMILELADACEADYIITGNSNDFTFSHYKKTLIVTPKQYWDNYQP
ncbi:putative toxin-antitoxin system toxin component, PIN family [Pedobacter sp. SD-b]|uniref:Toxin-antitoxin system toxin component, PIN family n=1 Tax=Pedobacter segetis TaxID=2793069 RepID=A0ABS1BKF5_9SPHI|nr:putative toxin-antitoxin system toxin component, PIN family [Pedobacter segetis]MBK0382811.1 putative toxin-antitoxin system toxin component, PIN family [Pedobacter segetis]